MKPRTCLAIKKILQQHRPQIFFCCKTKMRARQISSVCRNFNFGNYFVVDRIGMGGGLALFWNSKVHVHMKSYSLHHIDAVVYNEGVKEWRCTKIYGHLEANQKHHTWTLLKRLATLSSLSWCYFGDFNEVIHLHEKNGGNGKKPKHNS